MDLYVDMLRRVVVLVRLMLSGVTGLLTAQDWVPLLLLQLLPDSFSLLHLVMFLAECCLSLYQEGMFSLASDTDTLSWCVVEGGGL